jgi:hypothetical protein
MGSYIACCLRTDWTISRKRGLSSKVDGFDSGGIEDVRPSASVAVGGEVGNSDNRLCDLF